MTNIQKNPGSEATLFSYALTLKKNSSAHKFVAKEAYNKILKQIYTNLCPTQYCYEIDTKGTLHYHSYIQSIHSLRYKDFRHAGYHVYFRRLFTPVDIYKWRNYLSKDRYGHKDSVHWYNRARHEYLFDT